MAFDVKQIPEAYELISSTWIEEQDSDAVYLRHKKTGARVALLANQDDNKVFFIGFRTPPKNSTGVAHIMEHSVLCGSDRYPAKDPFIELLKGSLNTFLNAITYPDKTMFPVASCNDQDFRNLMDVYLDAVFHPAIYQHDEIFRQEGWHYEITDPEEELTYNGVVYNEMRGAYSSPDEILNRNIVNSLYPDTIYHYESGGDPDEIPQLTYEQFLDFHRRYYRPSNSYIYLYGNMDFGERLAYLDREYLSHYDYKPIDSEPDRQPSFAQSRQTEAFYPDTEDGDDSSYLAENWVIEDNQDPKLQYAFVMLEYMLLENQSAPLKKALLQQGLGEDVYGSFETDILQPYFSLVIKGMDPARSEEILALIQDELTRIADEGLNPHTVEGTLNFFEFRLRENDTGRFPRGLMLGLQMMSSWLYDETKPFTTLSYGKVFREIRRDAANGYFEQLIRTCLLGNPHSSVVILKPDKNLMQTRDAQLREKLAQKKASLSADEVQDMIDRTAQLKAYQSEPSPKEVLEKIPVLTREDIRRNVLPLKNRELQRSGYLQLQHPIATNGINYVTMLFDVRHLTADDARYLGILSEAIGNMDTAKHSYEDLNDEINFCTGGIYTNIAEFTMQGTDQFKAYFRMEGRALFERTGDMLDLMREMLTETDFSDKARLKEVLQMQKSRMESEFNTNGHSIGIRRAYSYIREVSWFDELTSGIEYYHTICDLLDHYDEKCAALSEKLQELAGKIFCRDNLFTDWICTDDGIAAGRQAMDSFAGGLFDTALTAEEKAPKQYGTCPYRNEAFTTAGMVQYDTVAGSYRTSGVSYTGAFQVLRNIFSTEYLWNRVRVLGGAYGVMCDFGFNGYGYFTSYRDPHLEKTYQAFREAADYVEHFDPDEREMMKYVVGTFAGIDAPLLPPAEGARSLAAYMIGRTEADMQKTRDEILSVTPEKIRALAPAIRAIADEGGICVVGSQQKVEEHRDKFERITVLTR